MAKAGALRNARPLIAPRVLADRMALAAGVICGASLEPRAGCSRRPTPAVLDPRRKAKRARSPHPVCEQQGSRARGIFCEVSDTFFLIEVWA